MVSHGICYVISSYIFGWLVRYIGRIDCFISAAILNYAMIVWMYFWEPVDHQIVVLFIITGVWGIADAIWQSQLIGMFCFCSFTRKIIMLSITCLYFQPLTRFSIQSMIQMLWPNTDCGNQSVLC